MSCINEETAMMYADGELTPAEALEVERHLPACVACRELISVLREENAALVSSLHERIPNRRWVTLGHLAGSIAASVTVAVPLQWVVARLSEAGTLVNYVAAVPFEIAFRAWRTLAPLLLLLVIAQIVSPAMTRRGGSGAVVIPAQETIADSVIATGDTVLVEGKIQGNLFMFGRSLEIRGDVDGDVIAGGQEVRISGHVTGNVMAGAESVSVSGHVGGNVYAGCRNLHVEKNASVDLEVTAGAETVTVEGTIGRSLTAGAQTAVIAGSVGRGVTFSGEKVLVRSGGKIGGNINAEVTDRTNVQVDPGAAVAGKLDVSVRPPANPRTGAGTYIWELAVLTGAFLAGWLMMVAFPGFFAGAIRNVPSWASAGFGFVALIVIPVAAVLLCITLIGIPMAVGAVFLYVAGLYLTKIVVGAYFGRELIRAKTETGLPTLVGLLVGLVVLQALFFVPYAGGVLKFAVLCLGLGALAMQIRQHARAGS
jgi:cytoskeletal protein CcmA (bactofilin family)